MKGIRRHHNNKGTRQIKNGKTQRDVERWRKKYVTKENTMTNDKMNPTTKRLDEAIKYIDTHGFIDGNHNNFEPTQEFEDVMETILAALRFAKAMQPRPIEEAPEGKNGSPETYILVSKKEQGTTLYATGYRNKHGAYEWWGGGMQALTHFTPLPDQALKELEEALK